MADEPNVTTPPAGSGDGAPPPDASKQQDDTAKTFDADYVDKLRKESAKYRTDAKANADAAAELARIKDAQKSDADKAADRLKSETSRADAADAELLRYKIAAEKDVPNKSIRLLSGSTREEIEASADAVLELIGDAGKPRTPKPNPAQREQAPPAEDKDALARAFFGIT